MQFFFNLDRQGFEISVIIITKTRFVVTETSDESKKDFFVICAVEWRAIITSINVVPEKIEKKCMNSKLFISTKAL